MTDLKEALKAAKAARDEAAIARQAQLDELALPLEIEALNQEALDLAKLAELERQHGPNKVRGVSTDLGMVIVKSPDAGSFNKWLDTGETSVQDTEQLVLPCVVHPEPRKVDQILTELPATLGRLSDAVATLAGFRKAELEKKSKRG